MAKRIGPLPSADRVMALAGRVGRSLTDAGFSLHQCRHGHPQHALGGVCLLQLPAHAGERQAGVVISWTTHNRLLFDDARWARYSVLIRVMNETLGTVTRALGYDTEPFGTGGAWLIASEREARSEVTTR